MSSHPEPLGQAPGVNFTEPWLSFWVFLWNATGSHSERSPELLGPEQTSRHRDIIMIIIIITNLTYGPHKIWLNAYNIYIWTIYTYTLSYIQISPRKKLFFRVHTANKNSQTRTFAVKTPRDSRKIAQIFFFSAKTRGVSPRNFAQILRENSESFQKTLTVYLFSFCFVVLRPSQQLWSCRDGQLT